LFLTLVLCWVLSYVFSSMVASPSVHVETFAAGPLGCNCTILGDLASKLAIVIDPGGDYPKIQKKLDDLGLRVSHIVHTHTHIDHVGATAPLQRAHSARASIHEGDRFLYDMLPVQAEMLGISMPEVAEMESDLVDGQTVSSGALSLGILHTPGHTPGSTCFCANLADKSYVFAGDTLFRRSIGRTDLWGGDSDLIIRSIKGKLLTLPEETIVVAGHGPSSSILEERKHNPFVK
jgi:hydroxyacylglutathione hydrolase